MAVEVERLIASLEARTTQFEKSMERALGVANQRARQIEGRFKKMGDNTGASMAGAAQNIDTGQLAAQLNDIAVSLAGGMSPFQVMLQQGGQISQIFGPGTGVKGVLTGVGAAMASLLNPTNLVLFAIMGLGATAATYFLDTKTEAEKIDEVLKKHSALIGSIKDRYGDAVQGVREYAAESQAVLSVLAQANVDRIQKQLGESSRALAASLQKAFAGVGVDLASGKALGGMSEEYRSLADAATAFNASVRAGNPDIAALRERLAAIASTTSDQRLRELAVSFLDSSANAGTLSRSLEAARGNLAAIGSAAIASRQQISEFGEALRELSGIAVLPKTDAERAAEAYGKAMAAAGDGTDRQAVENEYQAALARIKQAAALKNATRSSGGGSTVDEYKRETQSIYEKIAALEVEASTIGKSRYEQERAKTAQDLMNAAQQAGVKITPALTAEIDKTAAAYASAKVKVEEMAEAQRKAIQAADEFRSGLSDGMSSFATDFKNGLMEGQTALEAFRNAASNAFSALADQLIRIAMANLVAAAFGPQGTTMGGGFLGAFFGGVRAGGGSAQPGRSYMVGERGPERFVPTTAGRIVPAGRSGGQVVIQGDTIDARGADAGQIAYLRQELAARDARLRRELPSLIRNEQSRARIA